MDERDAEQGGAAVDAPGTLRIGGQNRRRFQVVGVKPCEWTKEKRQLFLDALAQTCNVSMATRAAGMTTRSPYTLRKSDPVFAGLWQEALTLGYERLETALLRQALIGVNALEINPEPEDDGAADAVADEGDAAPPPRRGIPGSGIAPGSMTPVQVQVALAVLNRRDAVERRGGPPRGLRQATLAEAEEALTRGLESLARQKGEAGTRK